ncbi:MAG TPA: helix-turn-helix transcriptional regulator [Acidobacteriaceae bacterium]
MKNKDMTREPVANYLRTHRRKSGLSQQELAQILGYLTEIQVSRHERSSTIPGLLIAVGYEVIFHVPLSELFPGLYQTVEANIEDRLDKMEDVLQQSAVKGRSATPIARKLEWLWERRNPESIRTDA